MNPLLTPVPQATVKRIIFKSLILILSITLATVLFENRAIHGLIEFTSGGNFVIGALISGLLFTSIFTTPIAISALYILGQNHSPLLVTIVAAIGSVLGDTIILKIIHDSLEKDIETLTKPFVTITLRQILKSRLLHLPLIILGAIIIASPLPDEIGISILNFARVTRRWFYVISYLLNAAGILAITTLGHLS